MNRSSGRRRAPSLQMRQRRETLRYGQHSAASVPWGRAVRVAYGMPERKPPAGYAGAHRLDEAAFDRYLDEAVDAELGRSVAEAREYPGVGL